jgi:hypothetical protein
MVKGSHGVKRKGGDGVPGWGEAPGATRCQAGGPRFQLRVRRATLAWASPGPNSPRSREESRERRWLAQRHPPFARKTGGKEKRMPRSTVAICSSLDFREEGREQSSGVRPLLPFARGRGRHAPRLGRRSWLGRPPGLGWPAGPGCRAPICPEARLPGPNLPRSREESRERRWLAQRHPPFARKTGGKEKRMPRSTVAICLSLEFRAEGRERSSGVRPLLPFARLSSVPWWGGRRLHLRFG